MNKLYCNHCDKYVEAKHKVPWYAYLLGFLGVILFGSFSCPDCNKNVK